MKTHLILNKVQRIKLMEMCVTYYPETIINSYKINNRSYKNHHIYFKQADGIELIYDEWLLNNDNIPKSPHIIFGVENLNASYGAVGVIDYNVTHWYELVVNDLAKKILQQHYNTEIVKILASKQHPVDVLHDDYYLEEINLNIFNNE